MALNPSDPEAINQAAQNIVQQSQFASQHPSTWERVGYYITHPLDFLALVLNWVGEHFLDSASHKWIAAILAVLVAAILVFCVARFSRSSTRNDSVAVHFAPNVSDKSTAQLLREADALEERREWREAIRMRYAALIQQLGEDGVLRVRSGRTTGEYVREITTSAPAVAPSFSQATRIFEWVWYGSADASNDDLLEFKMLANTATNRVAA